MSKRLEPRWTNNLKSIKQDIKEAIGFSPKNLIIPIILAATAMAGMHTHQIGINMAFRCDPPQDLPQAWKPKRIIFYDQGLKVYGVLPYFLNRRLEGEFYSNCYVHSSGAFRGHGMIAPAYESNYTLVPYTQKQEYAKALLEWLSQDTGFEWAIASPRDFNIDLRHGTAFTQRNPEVWVPAQNEQGWSEGFTKAMQGLPAGAIQQLLGCADVG
jgi:hypothetical protein